MPHQPKAPRTLPRGVYEHPRGSKLYWIQFFEHGRRRRRKIGPRLKAAINAYQSVRTRILEGRFIAEPAAVPKFDELVADAQQHLARYRRPISAAYDGARLAILKQWFGSLPATQVTPQLIEQRLAKLSEAGRAGGTLNRYRSLLSTVFRVAQRNKKFSVNPVSEVPRRRESPGRIRFLSPEEEARLRARIRALYPHRLPEFDLALNTGMRQGEQYAKRFSRGLRWGDVNWSQGLLSLYETKNDQPRHIPLNSTARAALRKLQAQRNGDQRVCTSWDEDKHSVQFDKMAKSSGLPLLPPQTREKNRKLRRRWFEACVQAAALSDVTWHTLRHTFISRLVMAGVDLATVQSLAGHKDIHTTMRYAHLAPGHQRQAVARLLRFSPRQQSRRVARLATGKPTARRTA